MLSLRAILLCVCLVRYKSWAQEEETTTVTTTTTTEPDLRNYRDGYHITKAEVVQECGSPNITKHRFMHLCEEGLCGWHYDTEKCRSLENHIYYATWNKQQHPLFKRRRDDLGRSIGYCSDMQNFRCYHLSIRQFMYYSCGDLLHYNQKHLDEPEFEWEELSLVYASIAFARTYFVKENGRLCKDMKYNRYYYQEQVTYTEKSELCLDKLDKRPVCRSVLPVISFECNANVTCIGEDPLLVNVFAASVDGDKSDDQDERIAEGVTLMARYCFKDYRVNPYRKDINEAICTTLFTKFSNSLVPFYTKKCESDADVEPIIRAFCETIYNYVKQRHSTTWIPICRIALCILCSVVTLLHIAYHCFGFHRREEIPSPFGDDLPEQHERSLLISSADKIDLIYVHIPVNVDKFEMTFRTLNKDPTKAAHLRTDFTTNTCSFFKPEFAVTTKEIAQLTLAPLKKNRIYCVARVMGPTTVGIFPEGGLLHIMEKNAYTCFTHVGAPSASIEQIIALEQCVNKKQFEVSCLRLGEFFFFAIVGAKQLNKSVTLRLECRVDSLESKKQTLFQFGADAEGKVSMGCGTSPRKQIRNLLVDWKRVTMVVLRRQRKTIKVYVGLPGQPTQVLQFTTPDSLIRVEQLETIVSVDPEGVDLFFPDFSLKQSPIKGF